MKNFLSSKSKKPHTKKGTLVKSSKKSSKRPKKVVSSRFGLQFLPKLNPVLLGIIVVLAIGLGFWLFKSFAATTTDIPLGSSSTCGARVSTYNFQRMYDKSMPWNVPVCSLKKFTYSDDYVNRFWNFASLPHEQNAYEMGITATDRGNFATTFGFNKATDFSSPVYRVSDPVNGATTRIQVQISGQAQAIPSNLDSDDYNVQIGQGKGYLPDTSIPWNPNWKPSQNTDAEMIILDDTVTPAREYGLWGLWLGNDAIAQCGIFFRDRLCAYSAGVVRDSSGAIADYKTSKALAGGRGMGIQGAPMVITPEEVAQGEIRQALYMEAGSTMVGPACSKAQQAQGDWNNVIGKTCGFAIAPATAHEWAGATDLYRKHDGSAINCPGAARVNYQTGQTLAQEIKLPQMIPSGMRFAITSTDAEIDAWLATKTDYSAAKKKTAKIFAVALRDYGWFVGDTSCDTAFWDMAGVSNPEAAKKWAALGIDSVSSEHLMDGLLKKDKIIAIEPPQNQCADGTSSIFVCADYSDRTKPFVKTIASFYPSIVGPTSAPITSKTPSPTLAPTKTPTPTPVPTKTPTPTPVATPSPSLIVSVDKAPPSVPAYVHPGLVYDYLKGHYYMSLTWPLSTDNSGGTITYDIVKNGKPLNLVNRTWGAYADYDIVADSLYTYQVRAKDAAGNTSPLTTPVSMTIRCFWIFCSMQ